MSIVLAVFAAASGAAAPLPDPHWEVAFARGGDVWMARANGSHLKRLAKKANDPRWSPDGRKLAFSRNGAVWVLNLATGKERRVAQFSAKDKASKGTQVYADWDPKHPILLCSTMNTNTVRMVQYTSEHPDEQILHGILTLPTYAPAWSPSGKTLAFVRAGDIWVAHAFTNSMGQYPDKSVGWIDANTYYDDAQRLAPLAIFNDAETGASLITPYWVDELAWTRNERRLAFHFRRVGGSGVAEIGYLDLQRVKNSDSVPQDWATWSGFKYTVHWILDDVWSPRICPDGKTLSFTAFHEASDGHFDLFLGSWDGKKRRRILTNVENPDWRPR